MHEPKRARRTYAVADLHGRYDLLDAALKAIEANPPGTIVFLGDYIDRGPQSCQVIDRLMTGPPDGWRWVCLKGNHEDMMVETINQPLDFGWWVGNGGGATLASYADGVVPQAHLDWCRQRPLCYLDSRRVFVHADFDETRPADEQTEARLLWSRRERNADLTAAAGYVVHGHTPFPDGPVVLSGRCNLDTLAWRTGRLVVAVFDDDVAGGPASLIEVALSPRHRPYGGRT